jgi:hypothetical protein
MTEAMIIERLQQQADRVRDHSAHHVNRRIAREMDVTVEHCVHHGREAILERLAQLDREWDIDRVLMANFAVAGGITYMAGLHRYIETAPWRRRPTGLLYALGAQLGFLLLHASVGWCPPAVVWRRLGARTKSEIELERSLLLEALESRLPSERRHPSPEPQPPKSSQVVS